MVVDLEGIHTVGQGTDKELVVSNGFSTHDAEDDTLQREDDIVVSIRKLCCSGERDGVAIISEQ